MIQIECLGDERFKVCVCQFFDRPAMKSHVLFCVYGSEEGARNFEETGGKPNVSLVSLGQDLCVRWILQLLMGEGLVTSQLRYSIRMWIEMDGWMDGSM